MFKWSLFLILSVIINAHAIILEDLEREGKLKETLEGKRIGYYIGSFDPLHKGHEAIAQTLINQEMLDYILIYPAWGGDTYKNRSSLSNRLDMIFATFKDSPRIIVTRKIPRDLQIALTKESAQTETQVQQIMHPLLSGSEFVGIIGSDVVREIQSDSKKSRVFMRGVKIPEKHKDTSVGTVMALPVNGFIVVHRAGDDPLDLESHFAGRPILHTFKTPYDELSSTRIRALVKDGKPIVDDVNESVRHIIIENELYK